MVIDDVVSLLARLVSIDSANSSMDGPGEAELAREIEGIGRALGFAVTLDEALPGRPNVSITIPPTRANAATSGRRLLFDLHLDTEIGRAHV